MVRGGGSTENNDIKVGPREREYTRTNNVPSPAQLRCRCPHTFSSRSVVHWHENEIQHQEEGSPAPRELPEPRAILLGTRTRNEVSVNEHQ